MRKSNRSKFSIFLVALMLISTIMNGPIVSLAETGNTNQVNTGETNRYTIYPTPQDVTYADKNFEITGKVNIVYESKVDAYTKDRVEEILTDKGINYAVSETIATEGTNFIVGMYESGEVVDTYFTDNNLVNTDTLAELDANIVSVKDNVIAVLGKDIDSAFYGVTTLMHVFKQMEDNTIEELLVNDYADIKGRGFIEGYYGEPWSNEDRADLMAFGGQFKMNSYLYAPKDDPKHNAAWRTLYTEEELVDIQYLADAGNASKARFVYTLHPFMNDVFRFDSDENYAEDLAVIKEKFTQLLDNGVRKFGILGDDAGVPGGDANNYVKIMEDLTDWLLELEATDKYPGLVTDMIFTPNDYMGNGSSDQIQTLKKLPESVSIVQTGGRVWGEVSDDFTSTFTANAGRGPYLWINWPVTDNSKQHLIMGGNEAFLQPGVDPANIEGIVLNPMQQSEPSKTSIFANADYAWNIWDLEQAQKNWQDSFAYMDHLNINETPASNALRELSKHMINQDMDGRVVKLEESVELAPKLQAFKDALGKEAITDKAEALIEEFEIILAAAELYKENPGNERLKGQMIYWLDSAIDTANAAIFLLKAEIEHEAGNKPGVWENYSDGQAAFESSQNHPFSYIDHMEYAEVGVQHIVPFIKILLNDVSNKVQSIVNPDLNPVQVITNRTDNPTGELENLLDNKLTTEVVYKNPTSISVGTYIGVLYEKPITLDTIRFELGAISNDNDTFEASKMQYTVDGQDWIDIDGATFGHVNQVELEELALQARGVRLIATEERTNTWFGIKDIVVNGGELGEDEDEDNEGYNLIVPDHFTVYQGPETNLFDGNESSFVWYNPSGDKQDTSVVGDYIGLDLLKVKEIGEVSFTVGAGDGDKWTDYQLEYSVDGQDYEVFETYAGTASGKDTITEDLGGVEARYVRLTNTKEVNKWIKFTEVSVETVSGTSKYTYTNNDAYKDINVNHSLDKTDMFQTTNITLKPNEYLGVKLERIKELKEVLVEETSEQLTLEVSANGVEWTNADAGTLARYVRLVNQTNADITFDLHAFVVTSNEIEGPSFVETSIGYGELWTEDDSRKTNTLLHVFDKSFATKTIFSDYQKKDTYITYSLGEPREITSLRLYSDENNNNYIRDAKLQLSMDNETWVDVAEVGDGENNLAGGKEGYEDLIQDGYTHDTVTPGYYYFGNDAIDNVEAKYIRILYTADYNERYTHINEIIVNDGEYGQTENDPTFVVDPIEQEGFSAGNIIDNDLTTSFRPNMEGKTAGTLTYRLSEKTDVTAITIVQGGKAISNADVTARVGTDKWITLGKLDSSLNTFYNTDYDHIFEIKLTWGDVKPVIYEMSTSNNPDLLPDVGGVDKELLTKVVAEAAAISNDDDMYTIDSYEGLQAALEIAGITLTDEKATQEEVDGALEALLASIESLQELLDFDALIAKIAEAEAISNEQEKYTVDSFEALQIAINVASEVLANENGTQEAIDEALIVLQAVIDGLVEIEDNVDPIPTPEADKEKLSDAIESANKHVKADYTPESWKVFQQALKLANALLANEDATQQEVDNALIALHAAINGLKGQEQENPTIPTPKPEDDGTNVGDKDDVEKGDGSELPKTATNMMNGMLLGLILFVVGFAVWFMNYRRKNLQ